MSEACSRWVALSDRQALGDALSAQERAFLAAHAAHCPACGAEGAFFRDLSLLVDGSPRAAASAAPGLPAAVPASAAHTARRLRVGWALAALAASLVFAIALQQGTHPPAPRSALSARAPAPAIRIALASGGEIEVDGRPAQPGANIALGSLLFARSGAACLLVDQGIRACLAPGGLLRVAELSETSRRLELRAGKLAASLEPQRAGSSFGIVTREGSAIAIGTAFSVEVPPDGGPVVTRVVHGTVLVRSAHGAEQHVRAHQASTMQEAAQPLSARDEAGERPLLELAERAPRTRPGSLRVESQPAGAQVLIDGRPVGVTPLGLLLEPGEHALLVNGPQGRSWREQLHVTEGAPLLRSFADPARGAAPALATRGQAQAREASGDEHAAMTQLSPQVARGEPPDKGHSTAARLATAQPLPAHARNAHGDAPSRLPSATRKRRARGEAPDANNNSASQLLSTAREQRARGDLEGAFDTYRALFARHGDSDEALAARVAYGEMLLASDRDPSGALAAFEHYRARGGPLSREASFGRVRALRALGKLADERAALEDFLRSFPDGPLADAVRARQRALDRP